MVEIVFLQKKECYRCEECGFYYREKEWAEKCEAWCGQHHACNLEITAHAISEKTKEDKNDGKE
jgi:hypothetical protein